MPLEISNLLKDSYGLSFSSRGLNSLFCNKFYTALILTIIILILIMNIYPCKKGTPAWITFKLGFYVLMASLSIIFIHDGIVHGIHEKDIARGETNAFINALGGGTNPAFTGDNTVVRPNFTNTFSNNKNDDVTMNYNPSPQVGNEELFSQYGV
jgi:hypothetical protein